MDTVSSILFLAGRCMARTRLIHSLLSPILHNYLIVLNNLMMTSVRLFTLHGFAMAEHSWETFAILFL
ncbi:MAG: hypothetical protein HYY67_02140 [Thaumarchaeota archaeon]|nr:hypothetical protein [Nitrososphaerota archaeon]